MHGACSVRSIVANNGGSKRSNATWQSFWEGLTQREKFREECPIVCTLVEIIIVTPHGSTKIERVQ